MRNTKTGESYPTSALFNRLLMFAHIYHPETKKPPPGWVHSAVWGEFQGKLLRPSVRKKNLKKSRQFLKHEVFHEEAAGVSVRVGFLPKHPKLPKNSQSWSWVLLGVDSKEVFSPKTKTHQKTQYWPAATAFHIGAGQGTWWEGCMEEGEEAWKWRSEERTRVGVKAGWRSVWRWECDVSGRNAGWWEAEGRRVGSGGWSGELEVGGCWGVTNTSGKPCFACSKKPRFIKSFSLQMVFGLLFCFTRKYFKWFSNGKFCELQYTQRNVEQRKIDYRN